jgi:hypothetical protein
MFGPAKGSPFSNNNNSAYNKLKINTKKYVNAYFARGNNKATINNANRNILRNIKAFINAHPRQAAVAGAAAGVAEPENQAAVTANLLTPNANSASANAAKAANAGGAPPAVEAAAETARQTGTNVGAAAANAAVSNAPNAKAALKAINWASLTTNTAKNAAINKLHKNFINKWGNMNNNGLNNFNKSILATIKSKLPTKSVGNLLTGNAAGKLPAGNNAKNPFNSNNTSALARPSNANGPFMTMIGEWANNANKNRNIYAKNNSSTKYFAKKNKGTNNYYHVINGISGKKIFDKNNKNAYSWNKNTKNFTKKLGNASNLGNLARAQAASIASSRTSNNNSSRTGSNSNANLPVSTQAGN